MSLYCQVTSVTVVSILNIIIIIIIIILIKMVDGGHAEFHKMLKSLYWMKIFVPSLVQRCNKPREDAHVSKAEPKVQLYDVIIIIIIIINIYTVQHSQRATLNVSSTDNINRIIAVDSVVVSK